MATGRAHRSLEACIAALALVLASAPARAEEARASGVPFALWLVAQDEPHQAITELLRVVHDREAHDPANAANARLLAARIALRADEPLAADDAYARYLAAWPAGRTAGVYLERARAQLQLSQLPAAASSLDEVRTRTSAGDLALARRLSFAEVELALRGGRLDLAVPLLEQAAALPGGTPGEAARALRILDEGIPARSPAAAGALSALVPGVGQLYASHAIDALVAFGATTTAGLLAIDAYDRGRSFGAQRVGFYVTAALGALIYGWNVVGAADTARHFNQVEELRFRRRIIAALPALPAPAAPLGKETRGVPGDEPETTTSRPSASPER